jgi:hypothetical protein
MNSGIFSIAFATPICVWQIKENIPQTTIVELWWRAAG